MNFDLPSVNHAPTAIERKAQNARLRSAIRNLTLSFSTVIVVGCGSAAQDGESPSASASSPAAAASDALTIAPTTDAAPATRSTLPPPTAEQIARWTPAAFDPVVLLAIREWEKTSFTSCLAPTPDGKHVLVAGSRVLLWSVPGEALEPEHVFLELTAEDDGRDLLSLAVSPDGKWFAVGDSNGKVRIWSLVDRQEIVAKELGSNGVTHLAISPDAKEIAAISYDSEVTTWSAGALEPLNTFKVDTNSLKRIEYLAPNMLAAAGESMPLWNTSTGQRVQELSPGRYSFALARSPDGSRFIFGGDDSLHIWHVADSKEEAAIAHGVSGSELIAFSPDGKFLATTNGGSVVLWNLAERRIVQVIDSFGWPIVGVSWLPETNLLAVASDIGVTRIWGTPAQGAAVGLKPLHAPVTMPDPAAKAPATQAQLEQVIDLRTFPRLPGSEPSIVGQGDFSAVVPVASDEAKSFYKYFLEQAGWTEALTPSANPAALEFRKNGFRLSVSCYDAGDGKTNVMVHHDGNYDLRWVPKFDAAPTASVYEGEDVVTYSAKTDLLTIETTLLRKLHAAGWTPYTRLHTSSSEQSDARDMDFLRNGTTLRVSIGKFPVAPDSYTIQYSLFPNNAAAPVPPDSGYVEFDGSTEPQLVAITAKSLDEARQFYDDELAAQGWLKRDSGQSEKGDSAWLSCLRGQSDLTVGFAKLPDGRTLVRMGDAGGSLWELSQAEDESDDEAAAVGLEAADFPVLNESKTAAFDAIGESIEVKIEGATLADAAEQYVKALADLGWKLEDGGIRSDDYTMLDFSKEDQEITLRARLDGGAASVSFQGDGLLWTKDLPGGKQIVSFETWLRQNKLPPGLDQLDRFEAEMRAILAAGDR